MTQALFYWCFDLQLRFWSRNYRLFLHCISRYFFTIVIHKYNHHDFVIYKVEFGGLIISTVYIGIKIVILPDRSWCLAFLTDTQVIFLAGLAKLFDDFVFVKAVDGGDKFFFSGWNFIAHRGFARPGKRRARHY